MALFAQKAAFLRTPKTSEQAQWWHALRANWAESALALLGAAGIAGALSKATTPSGLLLAALLVFPTLGMAAAPCNSWAARRASLPPSLRERRGTEYRRERRVFARGAATGGLVTALCAAIAAGVLMFVPNHLVNLPHQAGLTSSGRHSASRPAPSRPAPWVTPTTPKHPRPSASGPSDLPSYLPTDLPSALSSYLS